MDPMSFFLDVYIKVTCFIKVNRKSEGNRLVTHDHSRSRGLTDGTKENTE
jgi:hypothetical protein